MSERLITRVGQALYGETWKGPMARDTGIRKDTIDDWDKGRSEPATRVFERLLAMGEERRSQIEAAIAQLKERLQRRD